MGPSFKYVENKAAAWFHMQRVIKQLKSGQAYVKAGVVGPEATAEHSKGLTNALLAMFMEFGTDSSNPFSEQFASASGGSSGGVPARSFIREPFAAHRKEYLAALLELVPKVMEGKMTTKRALDLIGLKMATDMKKAIVKGIPPPNAESTIAAKGSSKPLIDSGKLLSSITHASMVPGAL